MTAASAGASRVPCVHGLGLYRHVELEDARTTSVHYVNWQRRISVEDYDGHHAIVKTNKTTKGFHEALLILSSALVSCLLGHPARPNVQVYAGTPEGWEMRKKLLELGIATPKLFSIAKDRIIEEYVEGGDLYSALRMDGGSAKKAYHAGSATGIMHRSGLVFTDNKAQNYLLGGTEVLRTDLSFIQEGQSVYLRSIDVASFLASVIDLDNYGEIEGFFFKGYETETGRGFPYLSLILRNILALGLSSRPAKMVKNMMSRSDRLLSY